MVEFDPHTALLVVDVQNDFADPGGSLFVTGAPEAVGAVNQAIEVAISAGSPVIYTQDWHPPDTPHFEKDGGVWPVHCVRDTWGAEFHPELRVEGEVVRKGAGGEDGYSGFTVRDTATGNEISTGLEALLRERDVESVVVVGLATDYCVRDTAIDAVRAGFATSVLADAIRGVDLEPGDSERAVEAMTSAGARVE
jgi:nicotinamidase/pyrazinamidase